MSKVRVLTHQEGNFLLGSCVAELLALKHHHYYDLGTSFKKQATIDPPYAPVAHEDGLTFILVHDVSWGLGSSLKAVSQCLMVEKVEKVIMCVLVNRHENPREAMKRTLTDKYTRCDFHCLFDVPRDGDLEELLQKHEQELSNHDLK